MFVALASILLLSYLGTSEAACGGVLGTVQNAMFDRNSSLFAIWNPPIGWEDCDELIYEIRFNNFEDHGLFFTDITSKTQYIFHYAAENFLCQIFVIEIIPKYNNITGELIDSVIFADNFTRVVIDPVQSLRIQELGNNVLVRWDPSTQFRACWANNYVVEIFDGDRLVSSWQGQREFYTFDFKAENLCETEFLIKVTAHFREFQPSTLTRKFRTGSC